MVAFEQMWAEIAPIGRSASTGGYFRQPFTTADAELRDWFRGAAQSRGLKVETDRIGNMVAEWRVPMISYTDKDPGKAIMVGSHLDSVLDGGAYDGPLGVVSALAAVDLLRERGFAPARPILLSVFTEEEGSRFGSACLGSRLATGATTWEEARELRDASGEFLGDAMDRAGLGDEPGLPLDERISAFIELHVEQGRHLVDHGEPVGVASGIWPHGRYRFDFTGVANHAGTTPMEDRADPMQTFAMTALVANKQARLARQRATFGRVDVTPNATNAVPSRVTAWLDARADTPAAVQGLVEAITRLATARAERDGTDVMVTAESISGAVDFDEELARWIAFEHGGADWPIIPTAAGHDAGIISAAGIPTAMLFVRNPTGVSHSPAEHVEMADCLAGVEALAETITRLAS
jgi:beta-ureidopropionase / N-carbamoyl-L-amino-acid hydrolase